MKKKKTKVVFAKLCLSFTLVLVTSQNLFAKTIADLNYRRSFITFANRPSDPGLYHTESDREYVRKLFGQLIQTADKLARKDWYHPELGISKNYYGFLFLSMLVPHHESSLMHFTLRDKEKYCYFSNDILAPKFPEDDPEIFYKEKLAALATKSDSKSKSEIRKIRTILSNVQYLKTNFKNFETAAAGKTIQIKHCSDIKDKDVFQLLFSNDYADVGMFMFNAASHADFFSNGHYLNLTKSMNYALRFLYEDGYNKIANNSHQYSCLKDLETNDPKKYLRYLMRGSWAGKYNSGRTSKTCRFLNANDQYAQNDINFYKSLLKFLTHDETKSLFEKFLPPESNEFHAFLEIVQNVENLTDNHQYLDIVLKTDYSENTHHSENEVAESSDHDEAHVANDNIPEIVIEPRAVSESDSLDQLQILIDEEKIDYELISDQIEPPSQNIDDLPLIHVEISKPILFKVKLDTWVSLREVPSTKNNAPIGTLGPGVYNITEKKILDNTYLWLKYIDAEKQERWFYAGVESSPKVEYIYE